MHIIEKARIEELVTHLLCWDREGTPGCGFAFDCDAQGNVDVSQLSEPALDNYELCLLGQGVTSRRLVTHRRTVRHPAVGLCHCGGHVTLRGFTNTCQCGADYNHAGQRLAPRSHWGKETGEHWTDCY